MDTTGAHINGSATPNKDYTKEELSVILKFGAQNLFKTDEGAQTQKLDEMDLDDVLTKADAFDTEAAGAGTTSLGGEGFLSSFAEIQDVKNDMDVSWDDIIPVDERTKMDEELAKEEAELGSRKRTATRAPVSYEGMDSEANKKPVPPRKSNAQRSLELKGEFIRDRADVERDLRVLIRGLLKWGDIRNHYDDIVKEARLEGKNRVMIIQTCEDILQQAEQELKRHKDSIKDFQDRGEPVPPALRQKAVLFTYKTVTAINAETLVARFYELKALQEHFKRASTTNYRLPFEQLKPTMNWSVEWTPEDDAHLLVGLYKYGFSSWDRMAQDDSLALKDKMFLEEKKGEKTGIPGSIHLVRRGDYLCKYCQD